LCHLMAEQVLAHPCDALFEGYVPTTPSAYTMAGIHYCQPSDDTEDAEFPAHDGFIGGRKDPSQPRVSRINQRNTAPVRVSELLRYAPEDNAGFAKAWPGKIKIIDGGYAMDYHAMPDPIPCYARLKVSRVQKELHLLALRLTDNDEHTHIEELRFSRGTRGRGRVVSDTYNVYTVVYTLRYLQTLDAACAMIGPDHWLFLELGGKAHMPLLCNRQYMGRKHKAPFYRPRDIPVLEQGEGPLRGKPGSRVRVPPDRSFRCLQGHDPPHGVGEVFPIQRSADAEQGEERVARLRPGALQLRGD